MNRLILAFVVSMFALAGCATVKVPVPTGGSRADGTVQLSYEVGGFEKPVVDWNQALGTAEDRCRAWGYHGAQPFGGTTSQCQATNQYGCVQWLVTASYQCTGVTDAP
ncbi:MAG: hypothetical protein FJ197_12460 [Gammaproteobacteria bacterium]|nr:hypothetical protein [Gammaproteobacteria bacterium]